MILRIASDLARRLQAEAGASPDREICGLLLGTDHRVEEARATANLATAPGCTFELDARELIAAYKDQRAGGLTVLGHYHSHPSGLARPSATDRAQAAEDGRVWLIVTRDEMTAWIYRAGDFDRIVLQIE